MYPAKPVDELGAAMESGDQGRIMSAMDGVGSVCHNCHLQYMAPAHHRYHWNEFSAISVTDPLTGQDVGFPEIIAHDGNEHDRNRGQPAGRSAG